ncbi:hypothetical protein ACQPZQ_43180 [Pseudonocardia sp. CA-142604]|uniref:hypothetical protein n=1 Tax=Pseudonocardia sp. CA-142604 TaxID=3240024 RepID=UPI003D89DDA0
MDSRNHGTGAQILTDLGVQRLRLITNNPAKFGGLDGHGLQIVGRVGLPVAENPHNVRYLRTKQDRMGHRLSRPPVGGDWPSCRRLLPMRGSEPMRNARSGQASRIARAVGRAMCGASADAFLREFAIVTRPKREYVAWWSGSCRLRSVMASHHLTTCPVARPSCWSPGHEPVRTFTTAGHQSFVGRPYALPAPWLSCRFLGLTRSPGTGRRGSGSVSRNPCGRGAAGVRLAGWFLRRVRCGWRGGRRVPRPGR